MKVETAPRYEKEIDKFNEEVIKEFNKQSKKFYKSKEAAHKKHHKIKGGKPIETLDPESIKICCMKTTSQNSWIILGYWENINQRAPICSVQLPM